MAIFTSSPVVSPAPDNYFSQAGADQNAIKTAAGRLGVDYTQQVQPAQINMLLSSMDGIGGDPQPVPAGGQQAAVPSGQDQAGAGQSMLTGATPQSADPQTQQMVGSEAAAQGVNPDWAMRVHYAESGLAKTPFGPGTTSPAGAKGPMQLMDGTAADLGVDSSKLDQNIEGGVTYLAQMKQRYGNPVLATAAYNAGPGRVDAFLSGQGNLPHETVAYVGKVFGSDDGASLLNDALSGAHGHPIGGVPTDPTQRPGVGLEPQQSDPAAAAAVRQLVMQGRYYAAMPDGKGVRAAAAIQAQLDNIAGPGGIVDPRTGNVYRVPGSFATRFAASNAAEAGKTGPAAALYATNEGVRQAGDQRTHAANAGVDVLKAAQTPTKVSPGEILTTPAAVGVGPQAPPQMPAAPSAPAIPNPNGLLPPPGTPIGQPPRNTFTPAASSAPPASATPGQGIYQATGNPAVQAAAKEGDRTVEIQQPILDQARESQNALNRVGQVRAAMKQATANGLPPGYFSPALAEGAAAAKSLGIDLSTLGINPAAIQNEQVAREALTQINGEILKRMFPQRITNADVTTFGKNLAQYGMDPSALEPILNQVEQAGKYDVGKAHSMLGYKAQHGNLVGWDTRFYKDNGFGPDLFDAIKSGTVPPASGTPGAAASAPKSPTAGAYTMQNPFKGSRAEVQTLPSGTPFVDPKSGNVLMRH